MNIYITGQAKTVTLSTGREGNGHISHDPTLDQIPLQPHQNTSVRYGNSMTSFPFVCG